MPGTLPARGASFGWCAPAKAPLTVALADQALLILHRSADAAELRAWADQLVAG